MDITIRGHRCVYDCVGTGPNITLLHSLGLSTREGWRYQIEALARHFRVLTFDFRGLGQSERGNEPLGVETFVQDLEALLQALGIARTALMGVSLGGFVAQEFTLSRPDVVAALVLVSTACKIHPGNALRRRERNEQIKKNGMASVADHQLQSHFSGNFAALNPHIMAWYKAHYIANDPESYISLMEDLGRFDIRDRIGKIGCPTLIVAGAADATSVAGRQPLDSANTLHRLINGSKLTVIEGAHHYPQIDHPEMFITRVVQFLTDQQNSASTPAGMAVT